MATLSKTPSSHGLVQSMNALSLSSKTPGGGVTPGRSHVPSSSQNGARRALRQRSLTPSRNANFMGIGGGDRFMPNRSEGFFERASSHLSAHSLTQDDSRLNVSGSLPSSPRREQQKEQYRAALMGGYSKSSGDLTDASSDQRILAYRKGGAPLPPTGATNHQKVLYSASTFNPVSSARKSLRYIPPSPERVLDAPGFLDDYYLNLMDWSRDNVLAIALENTVHLWQHVSGCHEIVYQLDVAETAPYISSLAWSKNGQYLSVGLSNGAIHLVDPGRPNVPVRIMEGQGSRISSASWLEAVISSGCQNGRILHHDTRIREHLIGQEVCGLRWSLDGNQLASGGNDNLVHLWPRTAMSQHDFTNPLFALNEHQAAVKALTYCPWRPSLLATGGGSADRHVRFWNSLTGQLINAFDTGSQVNALAFNEQYKEVITAHGYPDHVLRISKYPSMDLVTTLKGHESRILSMAMSPDEQWVMSASADETLRLWHCFKVDESVKALR